jgi:signal transduction histidine kinase
VAVRGAARGEVLRRGGADRGRRARRARRRRRSAVRPRRARALGAGAPRRAGGRRAGREPRRARAPRATLGGEAPPVREALRPAAGPEPAPASPRDLDAEILHDLRSPLSVIRVYTDLIQEAARRGELPNEEYLSNLVREIELAERLVGTPAPIPEPVDTLRAPQKADLVEILGSLATAYRWRTAGASDRVHRRAAAASRPGGSRRAAARVPQRPRQRHQVHPGRRRGPDPRGAAGPQAFVVVKDTGMGMSPEERARAFDYAFRGSGAVASGTRGKGLGLAVTKEILEANGGKISLSSEAGYGSEVTIMLPFQRGAR